MFFNVSGIITHLPFRITPSITAISSQNVQYSVTFCAMWSLFSCHLLMICSFSSYNRLSCDVSCCSLHIIMHSGMFVVVFTVLVFTCVTVISSSLFSLWFCPDSQSALKRSGPGLYIILALYWCILRRVHCSLCNNIATPFMNIATHDLWSVSIFTSFLKQ